MRVRQALGLAAGLGMMLPWAVLGQRPPRLEEGVHATEVGPVRIEVVTRAVRIPSAIAFLPDGRALVADRPVGLFLLDPASGALQQVGGLPPLHDSVDGGLLDVLPHPGYASNGWLYLSYAVGGPEGNTTVVDRARLDGTRLVDRERLLTALPLLPGSNHFGSRLALRDGYLFVTVGDRDHREGARDLATHRGKVLRLHEDGRIPADNPFVGRPGALPEIWTLGHRNPQGLAFHPGTGELWAHEHGPRGGDEVNRLLPGADYGWPLVSYGREYSGEPVGEGLTVAEGIADPLYYYVPSIGPSGMEFYTGAAFPAWRGSLFLGAMGYRHLNRLVPGDRGMAHEERLFGGLGWRVRAVRQGPDGFLYLGIDRGGIVRVRPAPDDLR